MVSLAGFQPDRFFSRGGQSVEKCHDDTAMRPQGVENSREGVAMAAKRDREIPVRKLRTEGKYSETREESEYRKEDQDDDEEDKPKKSKKPKDKEVSLDLEKTYTAS